MKKILVALLLSFSFCSFNTKPSVEILNCPKYILTSDTYNLIFEVSSGNEDIVAYYFIWLDTNGDWLGLNQDEYLEVEFDSDKILFPKANSKETITHNLSNLQPGKYILELEIQSQVKDSNNNYNGEIYNNTINCEITVGN